MVRLTSITTRGGDGGETSLGDGSRVPKTDSRLEAMGAVDALNACLGMARSVLEEAGEEALCASLLRIQNDLFDLGADLCVPMEAEGQHLRIEKERVDWLEEAQEALLKDLSPLTSFILPGGNAGASWIHLARAAARGAERRMRHVEAEKPSSVNQETLIYMNRLSDFLFCASRWANGKGAGDILWKPQGERR